MFNTIRYAILALMATGLLSAVFRATPKPYDTFFSILQNGILIILAVAVIAAWVYFFLKRKEFNKILRSTFSKETEEAFMYVRNMQKVLIGKLEAVLFLIVFVATFFYVYSLDPRTFGYFLLKGSVFPFADLLLSAWFYLAMFIVINQAYYAIKIVQKDV